MAEQGFTSRKIADQFMQNPATIAQAFTANEGVSPTTIRHALTAISLHPKTLGILATNPPNEIVATIPHHIEEPFEEVISVRLPEAYGKLLLFSLAQGVYDDHQKNEAQNPEQLATKTVFPDTDNLRSLNPARGTLPTYLGRICRAVIQDLQRVQEATGVPYSDQDVVDRLKLSSQALTAPAALTLEDFEMMGLEVSADGYLQADRDGRIVFTVGDKPTSNMRGRGCPMNIFGTLKLVFDHFTSAVEQVANERKHTN